MELSEQHILFCNEYLIDLNGTQAYIRAGYSPNGAGPSASRLLLNANIRAYIRAAMDERSKETFVDACFVVETLKEVVNRCKQAIPVMKFNFATQQMEQVRDHEGNGVWEFDSNGANKAAELLGKHVGLFDKDNIQKGNAPIDYEALKEIAKTIRE